MTNPQTALVGKTFGIAATAHNGQYRRDGTTPYIKHPMAVADRVIKYGYKYVCVAYLHDVLEDTKVTAQDLLEAGVEEDVVVAVQILTKHPSRSYDEYLKIIKQNELARRVKIADMLANLADDPTDTQIVKYSKGLQYLVDIVLPAGEYEAVHILSDVWQVKQNGISLSVTEKQFDFVD